MSSGSTFLISVAINSEKKQFNNLKSDVTTLLFIVGEHSLHFFLKTVSVSSTQSSYILSNVGTNVFLATNYGGND
jgi:hypothetical protein